MHQSLVILATSFSACLTFFCLWLLGFKLSRYWMAILGKRLANHLESLTCDEIEDICREFDISGYSKLSKQDKITLVVGQNNWKIICQIWRNSAFRSVWFNGVRDSVMVWATVASMVLSICTFLGQRPNELSKKEQIQELARQIQQNAPSSSSEHFTDEEEFSILFGTLQLLSENGEGFDELVANHGTQLSRESLIVKMEADVLSKKAAFGKSLHQRAELQLLSDRPRDAAKSLEEALNLFPNDITSQLQLAKIRYQLGDLNDSERVLANVLSNEHLTSSQRLDARIGLTCIQIEQGHYDSAESICDAVLNECTIADEPSAYIAAWGNKLICRVEREGISDSLKSEFTDLMRICTQQGLENEYYLSQLNLGATLIRSGEMQEAQLILRNALGRLYDSQNTWQIVTAEMILGDLLCKKEASRSEGIALLQKSLQRAIKIEAQALECSVNHLLAKNYYYLERFDKARVHIERSIEKVDEISSQNSKRRIFNTATAIFIVVEELEKAMTYASASRMLAESLSDSRGELMAVINMASVHIRKNNHDQAKELMTSDRFRRLAKTVSDKTTVAGYYGTLAECLVNLGEMESASKENDKAAERYQSLGLHREIGTCLGRQGKIRRGLGDIDGAIECHHQALDKFRASGPYEYMAVEHEHLAHCYNSLGQTRHADSHWKEAKRIYTELGLDGRLALLERVVK